MEFDNSRRFGMLNKNILTVCDKLSKNEIIARCLLELGDDIFDKSMSELAEMHNIKRESDLFKKYILPYKFVPEIHEDRKVFLMVSIDQMAINKQGKTIKNGLVNIDVLCHESLMIIDGGLRIYTIMEQVDRELNGLRINGVPLEFVESATWYRQPKQYIGQGMSYMITDIN